jgi:hypothetical protein
MSTLSLALSASTTEELLKELIRGDPGAAMQVFVEELGFAEALCVLADECSVYEIFLALASQVGGEYDYLRDELENAIKGRSI